MVFIKQLHRVWRAIYRPSDNTAKLTVKQALGFYYKTLPLPALLVVLAGSIGWMLSSQGLTYATFWSSSLERTSGFASSSSPLTTVFALACLALFIVSGLLNAAIFHVVSKKIFRIWRGSYAQTFTAVMYGLLPTVMLFWILSLPLASTPTNVATNIAFTAMYIWGAIVTILSLAAQHRISRRRAVLGYGVGLIVVLLSMSFYYNITITLTIWSQTIALFH